MRIMATVRLPVQKANTAITNGSLGTVINGVLERMRPESTYFYLENGRRTMQVVFDLKQQHEMVSLCEPLFLNLDAEIDFTPVMTGPELEAGLRSLG
jgi:hypothetical protein